MEGIIVLIIIAIIGNVLKNVSQKAQQQSSQSRRTTFPAGTPGTYSKSKASPAQSMAGRRKDGSPSETPGLYDTPLPDYAGNPADTTVGTMTESEPFLSVISAEGEKKQHKLNFTEDGILNGIIFSEILGPPKARRR